MRDTTVIDKAILYCIALSLVVHGALFAGLYLMPERQRETQSEPVMLELADLPEPQELPQHGQKTSRYGERRQRVLQERAPRGDRERDRGGLPPRAPLRSLPSPAGPVPVTPSPGPGELTSSPTSLPVRKALPDLARLYPSAERLASLEESYRKKYDTEIAEGETRFLNTEDIQFGSFLRRFETAVYTVWKYPAAAMRAGIQGVTPVKITFNRKGEIENIQLLRSSGSDILDREVFRALNSLGPIGSFPRAYDKEQFNLIAFFEYGLSHGTIRGSIR